MKTDYAGIDYSLGMSNVNHKTGIHYGVIPHNAVGSAWYESSEANYGYPQEFVCPQCEQACRVNVADKPDIKWGDIVQCPNCGEENECELPDMAEPLSFYVDDGETKAEQSQDSPDIFVLQSPYFTHAQYCSPCAPGACYLLNPCDDGPKAYCLGHNWFEDGKAPYPVYSVETGELIQPEAN